jgi:DNA-binding MarR family transcriptional regulator
MMETENAEPAVEALTELILEIFRLNGRLLDSGDALVRPLGLTSARWQVLGAVAMSPVPLPIAHLARNKGLSRQAMQRLANEMEKDGLVRFAQNPHHERAKLLLMTESGETAFHAAMEKQRVWASGLAQGFSNTEIAAATALLRQVRSKLEAE